MVVDVETTGLDPRVDELVSFGAIPIEQGRALPAQAVYGLVRPARTVPASSIEIHGITPSDLENAPQGPEALEPLADAVRGRFVIAHAAWVERSFLRAPLRRQGVRLPRKLIDTIKLWRLLCVDRDQPDPGFVTLQSLAESLGLPEHQPHHALGDALTTAQAFLALATHLEAHGRTRVSALLHADRPLLTHGLLHGRADATARYASSGKRS